MFENTLIGPLKKQFSNQNTKKEVINFKNVLVNSNEQQCVYRLANQNVEYHFEENKAVEFFDYLQQQYLNSFNMIRDFGLDVDDLVWSIENGDFKNNGPMDFLKFLGAEKVGF